MSYEQLGRSGDRPVADEPELVPSQRILAELQLKLESLPVIEQAKGMLMARYSLDADRAFTLLVRWSQHNNRKLRTVSEGLIAAAGDPVALEDYITGLQQGGPERADAEAAGDDGGGR